MRDPPEGDLYSFSHRDINTCDLDGTGVCIQTYMIDVDSNVGVKCMKVIYKGVSRLTCPRSVIVMCGMCVDGCEASSET
jgi:hypothetical protein